MQKLVSTIRFSRLCDCTQANLERDNIRNMYRGTYDAIGWTQFIIIKLLQADACRKPEHLFISSKRRTRSVERGCCTYKARRQWLLTHLDSSSTNSVTRCRKSGVRWTTSVFAAPSFACRTSGVTSSAAHLLLFASGIKGRTEPSKLFGLSLGSKVEYALQEVYLRRLQRTISTCYFVWDFEIIN